MSAYFRKPARDGNNYYQHDDRIAGNFSVRHVSFKTGPGRKVNVSRQRGFDVKARKYMDDNADVDMTTFKLKPRFKNQHTTVKVRGGKSGGKFGEKRLLDSPSSWYKVTLCHGKKYERQDIMKAIQKYIQPTPFLPVAVEVENDDMTFFVDNYKTAYAINGANLRLEMRDGWKMQIKVAPKMPIVELNPDLKEKIKVVMSSKYNAMSQHLDLSKFYANEEFLEKDIFVPLNRQNMLLAVFQIIAESVPNLRSLSLSDNKIFASEYFSMLKRHASDLKSLDLSKNKIRDLNALNCLQGLKLENLVLDDNPLCDKFQDQTTYVREVRKIFKSLLQLDGVELPAPVTFDIEENPCKLPQSHGSFLCNVDGKAFTRLFLEQYFSMYDSHSNRNEIIEAYADSAQFSMSAFSAVSGVNLNKYISESRNLKKVNYFDRRSKLLHIGKQEIVRFLNTLPKTQHDLPSFTVDLTVCTSELISMCISGVFRETEESPGNKLAYIKAFSRTFVLIPVGSGFNIVNDMLSITNASEHQIEMSFQPQPSTSIVENPLNTTPITPIEAVSLINSPEALEMNRKREMVATLAVQSGMNTMWSEKCLNDTNWDFNNALYAFTEFHKMGQIPAEAFNK